MTTSTPLILSLLHQKYKSTYTSAFTDLGKHIVIFSAIIYAMHSFRNSFVSWLFVPLLGFMLSRTFIVFHDCVHNSYTPSKRLNQLLAHVIGVFTSTSPNWFIDHDTHHLTNGNIENKQHFLFNETIILTTKQFKKLSKQNQTLYRIFKHPMMFFGVIPFLYFTLYHRFIYIVKKIRHPNTHKKSLAAIIFTHTLNNMGISCLFYALYKHDILSLYLASSYMYNIISFLVFHCEHSFNPSYVVGNSDWTFQDSGLKGSSMFIFPKYLKYFFMGIEYHHIHHLNSKIAGYNLQAYHEYVTNNSDMFNGITKLSMAQCFQNLWLVLYDEDLKRYIRFDEL